MIVCVCPILGRCIVIGGVRRLPKVLARHAATDGAGKPQGEVAPKTSAPMIMRDAGFMVVGRQSVQRGE
ncbi:MAG: hypothetical protein ACT6RL_19380 [Neoaquamicrobium sediminum]|uniref:hypothetical protein n=1 Tax=Neoaquamicrobium sediminum TaxID=1849104 RepID=UPI00403692E4